MDEQWKWTEEGTGFTFVWVGDTSSVVVRDEEGDYYDAFDSTATTYEEFVAACVEYSNYEFKP